jgi:glycerophosphoryl diester phosphodiesterase
MAANTIKFNKGNTLAVAHRGVSGLETENTCAAFIAAGNRTYWGVETDVYRTADGKFILNHDGNLKRIAGEDLAVEQVSFDVARAAVLYDKDGVKRGDLHLASVDEYVRICKKYGKICVLELKSNFTDEEIASLCALIKELDYLDGVTFIAFNIENLCKVRALYPEQPCQFLTGDVSDEVIARLSELKMDLDVHYHALTKERVDAFHAAGIKINCWTVDNAADGERLAEWGVDYITTNILE